MDENSVVGRWNDDRVQETRKQSDGRRETCSSRAEIEVTLWFQGERKDKSQDKTGKVATESCWLYLPDFVNISEVEDPDKKRGLLKSYKRFKICKDNSWVISWVCEAIAAEAWGERD